jgi:ribosomal protein S18 acetylase RimI-like enzyme
MVYDTSRQTTCLERAFWVTEYSIRSARLTDAEALHQYCYPEATLQDIRDYLAWCLRQGEKGRIIRLVAEVDGQAVGNAQLTVWGQTGEVGSLIIGRDFRRQGLARRLLTDLIDQAQSLGLAALDLEVSENQPAILAFYQRLGFCELLDTKKRLSHSASSEPVIHLRKLL